MRIRLYSSASSSVNGSLSIKNKIKLSDISIKRNWYSLDTIKILLFCRYSSGRLWTSSQIGSWLGSSTFQYWCSLFAGSKNKCIQLRPLSEKYKSTRRVQLWFDPQIHSSFTGQSFAQVSREIFFEIRQFNFFNRPLDESFLFPHQST